MVLAQDRYRLAREPAYLYLLREEFAEYGTRLRALNDRGDESPEGELADGILDQLAKFERAKTAERTRRGRLRRAREGKIVPNNTPDYGFAFNEARDNYVVNEMTTEVVRRIFYMVGVEGRGLAGVKKTLDRERVPTPGCSRYWSRMFLRRLILDDAYKPHTYQEVSEIVAPEVAARLDPERRYGIWYYGRNRITERRVAERSPDGTVYRRKTKTILRPRSDWIAVPIPDAGIPREWVEAARKEIKDNRRASNSGSKFWELSGVVVRCVRCALCGARMQPTGESRRGSYRYY